MARRRRVGDALSNIGAGLTDFAFNRMGQEYQSKLIADRQRELADQNAGNRLLEEIAKNPELAERLGDRPLPGGLTARAFTLTPEQRLAKERERLAGVNTIAELPTDLDLEAQTRSKDPEALAGLIGQRNARKGMIQSGFIPIKRDYVNQAGVKTSDFVNPFDPKINEALPTERTGEQEGQRGLATWMANEGDPTRNATERANSVLDANALIPGEVNKASRIAAVQQAALTKGEGDRQRQAYEIAAQDPAIAAAAQAVIQDPTVLDKVDARSRKYVIDAMNSDVFKGAARQQAVKMLTEAKSAIEEMWNHPGFKGAVGARGPMSLFGLMDPIAGSNAAGFLPWFDKFKAAMTLPNIRYMQGLGHMSDVEFGTIGRASTAGDTKMPEVEFRKTIGAAYEEILKGLERNGVQPERKIITQPRPPMVIPGDNNILGPQNPGRGGAPIGNSADDRLRILMGGR